MYTNYPSLLKILKSAGRSGVPLAKTSYLYPCFRLCACSRATGTRLLTLYVSMLQNSPCRVFGLRSTDHLTLLPNKHSKQCDTKHIQTCSLFINNVVEKGFDLIISIVRIITIGNKTIFMVVKKRTKKIMKRKVFSRT